MFDNRWMHKEIIAVFVCSRIICRLKKNKIVHAFCCNLNGPGEYYIKWSNSKISGQILNNYIRLWCWNKSRLLKSITYDKRLTIVYFYLRMQFNLTQNHRQWLQCLSFIGILGHLSEVNLYQHYHNFIFYYILILCKESYVHFKHIESR